MSQQKAFSKPPHLTATPRQVEGPFFLLDSPRKSHMAPNGISGVLHRLSGQILSTDGKVVPNATIHVWLADPDGVYDNQDAKGNPVEIPPSQHSYRGRVKPNSMDDSYIFSFLRPGNYPLTDEGLEARPAHLHFLVEAKGYSELITQLYFQDDPYNETDIEGPGFFKPELVVHYMSSHHVIHGMTRFGIFNFVLRKLMPKPNCKRARETSIDKIIEEVMVLASCAVGTLPANMKKIAMAYEDAAYLGIGMDRLTQMISKKLGNSRLTVKLEKKKISGRDTALRSGHWRFHKAEFIVTVKHKNEAPVIEKALLRYSTLESM